MSLFPEDGATIQDLMDKSRYLYVRGQGRSVEKLSLQ